MNRRVSMTSYAGVLVTIIAVLTADAAARPARAPSQRRVVAGLDEPLVATRPTSSAEDRELDAAVTAFTAAARRSHDAAMQVAPLVRFADRHPHSGWLAALHTNVGFAYYRAGYFARAFASWRAAWDEGRDATEVHAKAL